MRKYLYTILFSFLSFQLSVAQNGNGYINPMKHKVVLSSNYGELRPAHFHAGIDYKTEAVINKPVYSIADGYVSRIGISGYGYGNVLYITHLGTGETSVYAHLEKFAPKIDSIVKAHQYEFQTFNVSLYLSTTDIIVKQGELIAYSGNTGSSGGPHLHFEIRDTETEEYKDPLIYKMGVTDNTRPKFLQLKIYPQKNEGVLDDAQTAKLYNLTTNASGTASFAAPATIKAWGKIGLGIKAYDYADGATNILGVRSVKLEVDDEEVFYYKNTKMHPDETRYINSFLDYEEYVKNKSYIMKSFVEEGNFLSLYENVVDQGFITIDKEKDYQIKYTITDSYDNISTFSFVIKGVRTGIPQQQNNCGVVMPFNRSNLFETEDVRVYIPYNTLYSDICFEYEKTEAPQNFYSDYHQIHSEYVPLHNMCDISIDVIKPAKDSSKLYAIRYNSKGTSQATYAGKYDNGTFSFQARDFGKYVLNVDTIPPTITPLNISNFAQKPYLSFKIKDGQTSIDTYGGYIDDKWVLFEFDGKTNQIKYKLDAALIGRNKQHQLKLVVRDKVGNETVYTKSFYW